VNLGVNAANGVVKVDPISAQLYGGTLKGSAVVDASSDTPIVTEDLALQNVQAGGLVQDLFGLKRLSGIANFSMSTRALGSTVGEIRHTLNGRMGFSFKNGAIEGINIWDAIARAEALIKHQPAPPAASSRTEFTSLRGTGTIHNGVLDNRDLVANLLFLNLDGSGKLDLAENTLDYELKAHITGTPRLGAQSDLSGLVGKTIPLQVSGTLSSPSVRPDINGAVQNELQKKKQELRKKLENKLKGIIHVPAD